MRDEELILDAGCWMQDSGFVWNLDFGIWIFLSSPSGPLCKYRCYKQPDKRTRELGTQNPKHYLYPNNIQ
jgi:hypothetical protein